MQIPSCDTHSRQTSLYVLSRKLRPAMEICRKLLTQLSPGCFLVKVKYAHGRFSFNMLGVNTTARQKSAHSTVNHNHDDVIKWKHFPCYWPFVRGIHRFPVNSPYKGQWRGAVMFSLIDARINGWVNNREAGDLKRHRVHYEVIVMIVVHKC